VEAPQALTCNTNTGVRIDPQELKSTETRGVKKIIGRDEPQPPGKSDPEDDAGSHSRLDHETIIHSMNKIKCQFKI